MTRQRRTVTQAWRHAEIHENGPALKRLAVGFPHGCMAGIFKKTRYHINGRDFFVIGGAYSVDKYIRLQKGYRWFEDEQLTSNEMDAIRENVATHGYQEDIILAHTCPYDQRPIEAFLNGIDESSVDTTTERFLQEIIDMTEYIAFYCGHWHIEKQDGKIRFLFHDVISLEE